MLMASQQGVSRNADGIAEGGLAEMADRSRLQLGLAVMLMASLQGVSRNADVVIAAGG